MKYPITKIRNNAYHYLAILKRLVLINVYGMQIGENTRISRTARLDKTNPKGVIIGKNTSISFEVSVLTHDFVNNCFEETRIGDNCFIGGRAIILPGVTIGNNCIIGAGSVVMSDIPSNTIAAGNPARLVRAGIQTGEYGILTSDITEEAAQPDVIKIAPQTMSGGRQEIIDFIKNDTGVDDRSLSMPVAETAIDSFSLITLRTALEEHFSVSIPDLQWVSARSLIQIADLPAFAERKASPSAVVEGEANALTDPPPPPPVLPADRYELLTHHLPEGRPASMVETRNPGFLHRRHVLEMSKMALSGMGEPWLFRELNDLHWTMICDFLRTSSSQIVDGLGNRLYATITRCSIDFEPGLYSFKENTALDIRSELQRYGASMFLSNHAFQGAQDVTGRAAMMSTFAKYGERGNNKSLIKGSPNIFDQENVKGLSEIPEMAAGYRSRRGAPLSEIVLAIEEYDILGPHDINGVGLLYFAAYPMIFDLCIERSEGKGFLRKFSTVSKDILYFANAEPDETLIFKLHEREEIETGLVRHFCSLSRKSDGIRMAEMTGVKRKIA
jgi:probable biosynthetic protein (TIGR04098 family)